MNVFSKLISIIICIVVMFIFPIMYFYEKQDVLNQIYVFTETSEFVDKVRNCGYINESMYIEFLNKLNATNEVYNIKMEHSKKNLDMIDENEYYILETDDIILNSIYENKKYKFNQGDFFKVTIVNRSKSYVNKIMELISFRNIEVNQPIITYGGQIRDENY